MSNKQTPNIRTATKINLRNWAKSLKKYCFYLIKSSTIQTSIVSFLKM